MDDRQLRRAGLDYHEYARVQVHDSLADALALIAPPRLFALSSRGAVRHDAPRFAEGDAFLFGSETAGLPDDVLATIPDDRRLRLPMRPDNRRIHLSNRVAVMVFDAWRQLGFAGGSFTGHSGHLPLLSSSLFILRCPPGPHIPTPGTGVLSL